MASTLAGNLTITQNIANVIVAEHAKPENRDSLLGIFPGGAADYRDDANRRMGVAGVD